MLKRLIMVVGQHPEIICPWNRAMRWVFQKYLKFLSTNEYHIHTVYFYFRRKWTIIIIQTICKKVNKYEQRRIFSSDAKCISIWIRGKRNKVETVVLIKYSNQAPWTECKATHFKWGTNWTSRLVHAITQTINVKQRHKIPFTFSQHTNIPIESTATYK